LDRTTSNYLEDVLIILTGQVKTSVL